MSTLTEEEAHRCNALVEHIIKRYSIEEIAEIKDQLKEFLGLFVKVTG